MRNPTPWVVAALLVTLTCSAQSPRDEFIDIDGNRLHLVIQRPGSVDEARPTILLESGGGFYAAQWQTLQPQLADEFNATVVAYDRPGFGDSDLPDTPYDIREEVNNLHTVLEELELARRIVIVAHSYGALLAQLYAFVHPEIVAGLVLLDPNSPATMVALHDVQTRPYSDAPPRTTRERAFARIDAAIWETLTTVYRSPIPQDIPVTVVSAEHAPFPEERQNEAFRLTHQLLAVAVRDGRTVIAEDSNHMIPAQRPDVVIDSVRDMLGRIE